MGRWLGLGVGDLINLFNPEVVVLGGLYQRPFPHLEAAVTKSARVRTPNAPGEMATSVPSSIGSVALLIGAAELMLSEVIENPAGLDRLAAPSVET